MNRKRLFLLILLLGAVSLIPTAYACSCVRSTLPQYFERADVVFIAEITQIFLDEEPDRPINPVKATFNALEIFKGEISFAELVTGQDGGVCGLGFVEGDSYLFFASESGWVGSCGGSGHLARRLHYVRALNRHHRGVTVELLEPWAFNKHNDQYESGCSLSLVTGDSGFGGFAIWESIAKFYDDGPTRNGEVAISLPVPSLIFDEEAHLLIGNQRFDATRREHSRRLHFSKDDLPEIATLLAGGAAISAGPLISITEGEEVPSPPFWQVLDDGLRGSANRFLKCTNWLDEVWEAEQAKAHRVR